jgi:hypothetical protein
LTAAGNSGQAISTTAGNREQAILTTAGRPSTVVPPFPAGQSPDDCCGHCNSLPATGLLGRVVAAVTTGTSRATQWKANLESMHGGNVDAVNAANRLASNHDDMSQCPTHSSLAHPCWSPAVQQHANAPPSAANGFEHRGGASCNKGPLTVRTSVFQPPLPVPQQLMALAAVRPYS